MRVEKLSNALTKYMKYMSRDLFCISTKIPKNRVIQIKIGNCPIKQDDCWETLMEFEIFWEAKVLLTESLSRADCSSSRDYQYVIFRPFSTSKTVKKFSNFLAARLELHQSGRKLKGQRSGLPGFILLFPCVWSYMTMMMFVCSTR